MSELKTLARNHRWHCAVAFWGVGAQELLRGVAHDNIKIICNLNSGSTNPYVIESLPRHQVRQHDLLHAKVYIGDNSAVVCSANASANGLGLEGKEQGTWIEAGLPTNDIVDIILWFNSLWAESQEILDDDLQRAKELWSARRNAKPTLASFANFESRSEFFPMIYWDGTSRWQPNKEAVVRQIGMFNEDIHRRIGNGVQIKDVADRPFLMPGTWLLCGTLTSKGLPHSRAQMEWIHLGTTIEDAIQLDGDSDYQPVAIASETPPPEPFSIDDRDFESAFRHLIITPKYNKLLEEDDGPWFLPRRDLITEFWIDLLNLYRSRTS